MSLIALRKDCATVLAAVAFSRISSPAFLSQTRPIMQSAHLWQWTVDNLSRNIKQTGFEQAHLEDLQSKTRCQSLRRPSTWSFTMQSSKWSVFLKGPVCSTEKQTSPPCPGGVESKPLQEGDSGRLGGVLLQVAVLVAQLCKLLRHLLHRFGLLSGKASGPTPFVY